MRLFDFKLIFIGITILLCLPIFAPYIYDILPEQEHEKFISLGILGEEGLADNYFPSEEPIIFENVLNSWQLYVSNHMGGITQILIKVKLLEAQIDPPNISTCMPSPGFEVFEIRRLIGLNQTLKIPFEWMVTNYTDSFNRTNIYQIQINDSIRELNFFNNNDEMIRIVFEVWVFDVDENMFQFHWMDFGELRCVWTQIQFRITPNLNVN